jgi:hypothetical protein
MRYLVLLKALTIPDTPPSPELMAAIAALGEDAKNAGVLARPVANRGVAALLDSVEPIHQTHAVDSGRILGVVARPGDEAVQGHRHGQEHLRHHLSLDQATHQRVGDCRLTRHGDESNRSAPSISGSAPDGMP